MSGSIFGTVFTVATWGESHGPALGVVVDGCPSGVPLAADDIQFSLDRRKPGASPFATSRAEADKVEILSGVFNGKTTGTPIGLLIRNTAQRTGDYDALAQVYRPGHADLTYDKKYGFRDYRGGGRASGRETAARVAGGAVAKKMLAELGVNVRAYVLAIGDVAIDPMRMDLSLQNDLNMPDAEAYGLAAQKITAAKAIGDSLGGIVECVVDGLPPGVGEPVFGKLEAVLGHAVLSIGAVKGIEFGAGFSSAIMPGSTHNDALYTETSQNNNPENHQNNNPVNHQNNNPVNRPFNHPVNRQIKKRSNHAGGMYGGISDGSPIIFRAAIKPTPSIAIPQETVNNNGENITLCINGRHDPVIAPRASVAVEAMTALALADLLLLSLSANIDNIRRILL